MKKYLAICYIDSWHLSGQHFPSFFHQTRGYEDPEEAIKEIINLFEKEKYNLKIDHYCIDGRYSHVYGYADGRKFEIRVIGNNEF